jgi:hypothetical protein
MKKIMLSLLCLFLAASAYAQKNEVVEENCSPVPAPKEFGQSITFYAYCYHTTQFKGELRVSNVFQITYNFDPRARVDHLKIALRMSQDFNFFVTGMLNERDARVPLGPIAGTTQNYASFICENADAVIAHRNKMIEEFEKFEKPIHEETTYSFEYTFNQFYKASTRVTANKL